MRKLLMIIVIAIMSIASAYCVEAVVEPNWIIAALEGVFGFLVVKFPIVSTIVACIGTLVVVLTGIDLIIPNKYDKGFMGWFRNLPVVGDICAFFIRFSIFRSEKK